MRCTRALPFLSSILACGILSCGGGDSSGPELLLSGTYHLVGLSAETDGSPEVQTTWGTLHADGVGRLALTATQNRNGVVDGPSTDEGIPYSVDADRTVTVRDAVDPSVVVALGRVTPEGDVAVLGSSANDREPGMWVAVRRRGNFDTASLSGRYHGCQYHYLDGSSENFGYAGSWEFDGSGGFTASGLGNREGVAEPFTQSGMYAVAADGSIDLDIVQWDLHGGMLEDRRLVVLAGCGVDMGPPVLLILVRATPLPEDWDVQYGEHYIAGLERDWSASAYRSFFGTLDIRDDTTVAGAWSQNQEGIVTPLPPWSATWAADPDASFGFYRASGFYYGGGLEQAGRYGTAGGSRNDGATPAIFFYVR